MRARFPSRPCAGIFARQSRGNLQTNRADALPRAATLPVRYSSLPSLDLSTSVIFLSWSAI